MDAPLITPEFHRILDIMFRRKTLHLEVAELKKRVAECLIERINADLLAGGNAVRASSFHRRVQEVWDGEPGLTQLREKMQEWAGDTLGVSRVDIKKLSRNKLQLEVLNPKWQTHQGKEYGVGIVHHFHVELSFSRDQQHFVHVPEHWSDWMSLADFEEFHANFMRCWDEARTWFAMTA